MNKTDICYLIFGSISFVFLLCYSFFALIKYRKILSSKKTLTTSFFLIIGVYIAVVLVFLPVYYLNYSLGDSYVFIRPIALSLHNAFRVFILDGEFDIIRDSIKDLNETLHVFYSAYCVFLYIIAPILTFSTVLSYFKNFTAELRYLFCYNRPIYVMSELNERSIALAKSIKEKFNEKNPLIVFTDVFEQNNESDYELLLEAQNLKAICLKKDITHLNLVSKKGNIELFLIGDNETENISQGAKITHFLDVCNKKDNIKIFVFSTVEGSGLVMDSLSYDNLLKNAASKDFNDDTFKIRRVDCVKQLVLNTVQNMDVLNTETDNVISIMIAGMGSYGIEFFKTLIWYCQIEGYRLEINLFDKSEYNGKKLFEPILKRQCPELMEFKKLQIDGDANFDIKCFDFCDFKTDAFAKLLFGDSEDAKRLKRTSIAIVCLGDDNLNIETAVYLRSVFDRAKRFRAKKDTPKNRDYPIIYSIVYDETKSNVMRGEDGDFLVNYKGVPYHINFIGSIDSQFSYDNIYDYQLEQEAYKYHIEWSEINRKASEEMRNMGYSENDIVEAGFLYQIDDPLAEKIKYEKFEYYRNSSISKAIHKRFIRKTNIYQKTVCLNGTADSYNQLCECENCVSRKKMEHNRWNAYMRSEGYSYVNSRDSSGRADRAFLHNDLCNWDELSKWEKAKD